MEDERNKLYEIDNSSKYEIDNASKADFLDSTYQYLDDFYPQWHIDFEETPPTSHTDFYATATTGDRKVVYSFELKERTYNSDRFNDWMIEENKLDFLKKETLKGIIPIFVNLYPDGVIRFWRAAEAPTSPPEHFHNRLKSTVEPEKGYKDYDDLVFKNKDGRTFKRTRNRNAEKKKGGYARGEGTTG